MYLLDRETTDKLHALTLDGWCEDDGHVDSPSGWFALIDNAVIRRDTFGRITAVMHDTEQGARDHFDDLAMEYAEWLDGALDLEVA